MSAMWAASFISGLPQYISWFNIVFKVLAELTLRRIVPNKGRQKTRPFTVINPPIVSDKTP